MKNQLKWRLFLKYVLHHLQKVQKTQDITLSLNTTGGLTPKFCQKKPIIGRPVMSEQLVITAHSSDITSYKLYLKNPCNNLTTFIDSIIINEN